MGGHIRIGECEHVLNNLKFYKQHVWWLIIYIKEKNLHYEYIRSSCKQNLKDLSQILKKVRKLKHLLFAIWHGRWRTDIFLMNTEKVLDYITKEI